MSVRSREAGRRGTPGAGTPEACPYGRQGTSLMGRPPVEILWPGKYGPDGQRRQPDPAALARPLRTVATAGHAGGDRRNRLVLGDNLAVLSTWLAELRGRVDLVYIDPPFDVGTTHTIQRTTGAGESVAQTAFHDAWEPGEGGYLAFMAPRLELLRELLAETGSLLLHCDHRWEPGLALLCDELFGRGDRERKPHAAGFRNAVRWSYGLGGSSARCYPKKHDTILWYTRSAQWQFDPPRTPARSQRMRGETKKQPDVWDLPAINNQALERTGYPTQKPEALLERLILAHSRPGDLVLDAFCGSGTTPAVAARLDRRWLACDAGRAALEVATRRLLDGGAAFTVEEAEGSPPPDAAEGITARLAPGGAVELGGDVAAVDWWAVDYAPRECPPFGFDWHAGRSRKSGELIAVAPPRAVGPEGVAVRVVDARGGIGLVHVRPGE